MDTNKSYQSDVTLTSMKRAVKRAKSDKIASSAPDPYPYGLSINLDDESLEKLGIDIGDYSVGDELELHAKVKVRSLRQSESTTSGKDRSMDLQVTDMCVEQPDEDEDDDE